MRPNYHPEGLFRDKKVGKNVEGSKPITQLWHENGRCPEGTIPIRRTKKEDLLRASSIKSYGKKNHRSVPKPKSADPEPDLINQSGHQHAIAYVEGDKYYGAKATINVWDPKIQQSNEFSLSQIWILGGSFASDLNSIEAGWQVSPDLYGDSNTRLFTYWTSDSYQATGCYNLLCSGFIQINNEIAMGASIYPISDYHSSQYDISILVWKVILLVKYIELPVPLYMINNLKFNLLAVLITDKLAFLNVSNTLLKESLTIIHGYMLLLFCVFMFVLYCLLHISALMGDATCISRFPCFK
ncbi:Hypothetical predicted protein [Olea europaea subsp. europaea]|nr:Hypothetical predicted protein [Olea europaea subsp. europaea]